MPISWWGASWRHKTEDLQLSSLAHSRLRYLQQLITSLSVLAAVLAITLWWVNPIGALIFALAAATGAFLRFSAHRLALLGHGISAMLMAVILALSIINGGGLGAPVMMIVPMVPIIAFFISGSREGVIWLGLVLLAAVGMFFAEPYIGDPALPPGVLLRMHLLATVLGAISITGFIWQYDRMARAREAELEEARVCAEAAARARADFLATMSHEIRTPLGGILSAAQLLRGTEEATQRSELIEIIDRSSEGLLALLNQVLDLSRLEARAMPLEQHPFQPAALVREILQLHTPRAEQQRIGLSAVLSDAEAVWVTGDPLRVHQIVGNLVSNAIKFTEHGSVTVSLLDQPDGIEFIVADTGIGMNPSQQARLFEPFRQADEGIARRFGGSGLGMSIVARLVAAMGGRIALDSAEGSGTTFTVWLPLQRTTPPKTPAVASLPPLGLRVLVVDDNALNRRMFSLMLERVGCTVFLAEDGTEAVQTAPALAPDVILMDIHMPGMDGITAAQRLLARRDWQILALTASVTDEIRAQAAAAGMAGFLSKPLALPALYAALAEVTVSAGRAAPATASTAPRGAPSEPPARSLPRGSDR